MNAIQAFVPSQVVEMISAFLEFCYIVRRNIITDNSLEQLKAALHKFHQSHQIFSGTVRLDGPSAFSLPRQHAMVHYYDHIKNFGSPNGLCSSITESKHITAVKRPWRRSNKHAALPQILKVNERLDKIATACGDFTARGMLGDSCLIQAIKDALGDTPSDLMDEDADSSDETDSGSSDSEVLPNGTCARGLGGLVNDIDRHVLDQNDDRPHTPQQPPPAPPDDEEDDDYGPVESGPLMNEVRLVGRKG